ncbi:MAG: hypothetical protein AAFU85_18355 [Planctomycetota bacterium]
MIATDEAGYGPKLGPLVVCASVWKIDESRFETSFERLSTPLKLGKSSIVVDDSKAIFRPSSARSSNDEGYGKLESVAVAGARWSGLARDRVSLASGFAPTDVLSLRESPWLADFAKESVAIEGVEPIIEHWKEGDARLEAIEARVITARAFNQWCGGGANKSDLLSHLTLDLVRRRLDALGDTDERISVYCDRHGGRRFYAPPLQATFEDSLIAVGSETKTQSHYRVPYGERPFEIRFTVKGDSFAPVAFSSMVAKYLREKAMESLNRYFVSRHAGDRALKPTAGYPVDADRFLKEIEPTLARGKISPEDLVRAR